MDRSAHRLWRALITILLLMATLPFVGDWLRAHASVAPGGGQPTTIPPQDQAIGCGGEPATGYRVCPAPEDDSYPYIAFLTSYAASNGIAVMFTEAGMEHAVTCRGAGELATMIARLYGQIPHTERAEERIDWAIPQMTGEITGHARVYAAASIELVRNAANPVNIVFPEYLGTFQEGMDGVNAWAQQVYYASLCA